MQRAVVLVNTGTPATPRAADVGRFLRRFLSDQRVVELPAPLWRPLLYGLIVPLRAPRSAAKYRRIWLPEGSPLRVYGEQLRAALSDVFRERGAPQRVAAAYLYSEPGVATTLRSLAQEGCTHFTVLPLFPQTSGTTTGAVYDQVGAALTTWRGVPALRLVDGYANAPGYLEALAERVAAHWQTVGRDHLLLSFHGIPARCVARGDPYAAQCEATAAALASRLGLAAEDWTLCYQSRFGSNRWLEPATTRVLASLPRRGVRRVTALCPGFAVDCLETLEEIALEGRETFEAAGGERFAYLPALNGTPRHAEALADVLAQG